MSSHPVSRVQSATPDDIFERVATRVEELLAELYVYQRSYTPPPNQLANKRINVTIKALETALQSAREQPEVKSSRLFFISRDSDARRSPSHRCVQSAHSIVRTGIELDTAQHPGCVAGQQRRRFESVAIHLARGLAGGARTRSAGCTRPAAGVRG